MSLFGKEFVEEMDKFNPVTTHIYNNRKYELKQYLPKVTLEPNTKIVVIHGDRFYEHIIEQTIEVNVPYYYEIISCVEMNGTIEIDIEDKNDELSKASFKSKHIQIVQNLIQKIIGNNWNNSTMTISDNKLGLSFRYNDTNDKSDIESGKNCYRITIEPWTNEKQ